MKMRKHKKPQRWTAFATAVFFTASLGVFPAPPAHAAVPREPNLSLSADIQLPAEIGKIDEFFRGPAKEHVIIVQDAHAIPDAQRSIRKAILYFYKQYGIRLIALEGAASALDARILKSFPDKEKLNGVLGEYFDRGHRGDTGRRWVGGGHAADFSGNRGLARLRGGLGALFGRNEKRGGHFKSAGR